MTSKIEKYCPGCNSVKKISDFTSNRARHDNLASHCIMCARELYKKNRKQILEQKKKYYINNIDNIKQYRVSRYEANKNSPENTTAYEKKKKSDRKYHLKREYGITVDYYNHMINIQENKCKICKNDFNDSRIACVDHCHNSKKVRGILCKKCNLAIGYFGDNISNMQSAIQYLKDTK